LPGTHKVGPLPTSTTLQGLGKFKKEGGPQKFKGVNKHAIGQRSGKILLDGHFQENFEEVSALLTWRVAKPSPGIINFLRGLKMGLHA